MVNKAYIVANEQQEREVLEKFEREGMVWSDGDKLTKWTPSQNGFFDDFPYALTVINDKVFIATSWLTNEIVFDGRKEEKMSEKYVVSQEFMNELEDWKLNTVGGIFINDDDIEDLPYIIVSWWVDGPSDKENNNRLIAIIRWVNDEDVFEVEKPKKWVVRSDSKDSEGDYWYVRLDGNEHNKSNVGYHIETATRFDTKEEAQSWANSHQEVVEVGE